MAAPFTVTFDGHDITEFLRVTSLNRGLGPSRSSRIQPRNGKRGVSLLGVESTLRTHDMGFVLRYELISKRRMLSKIFNVDEPKPLIFSDEPDKMWLALPGGDINVDEKSFLGFGTVTWEIPDGVAYSVNPLTFENDGKNYIELDNPGTEPIVFDLEAVFTSDNGFLGLENDDGSTKALFGTIEEVDGYHYESSVRLFDDHFTQDRGWVLNKGCTPPVTPKRDQVGSVKYQVDPYQPDPTDPNEGYVSVTDYGTGDSWHGPTITKDVPADKNSAYPTNWTAEYRIDFNTDGTYGPENQSKQIGHNSLTMSDIDGNMIAAIVIEDNNPAKDSSDLALYVEGSRVATQLNTQRAYTNMRSGDYALVIEKIGSQVTFRVGGIKQTYQLMYPSRELRKATWYAAAYKDYPPVRNNVLRAINIRKHNVINWQDIPNKFADQDTMLYGIRGRNIHCVVNDIQWLQFRDPGSTLITAPPGKSVMYLAYSDFANVPIVKLTGRASYV